MQQQRFNKYLIVNLINQQLVNGYSLGFEEILKNGQDFVSLRSSKGNQFNKGRVDDVFKAECITYVALFHKHLLNYQCRGFLMKKQYKYDISVDHKSNIYEKKQRIERAGGFVCDGRVNVVVLSQLNKLDKLCIVFILFKKLNTR